MSIPGLPNVSKDKTMTARERELRAGLPERSVGTNLKPWLLAGLALLIGFGGGILVMRHRHQAELNIAAVNGTVITDNQLFRRLQTVAGPATLHQIVEEQLQMQFAAKKGVAPTDAEVEERFQKMHAAPNFSRELAASGLSADDYKNTLRVKLSQAAVLTQGISVTDAEVQAYYQAQADPRNPRALFYQPDTILVRAIGTASQATIARAQQELAVHTPFETVAAQYSQDAASKNRGGLLDPLQRGRSPLTPVPALEKAVFALKVGDQLGPVFFHNGWWIFRCEEARRGQTRPFDEVKDDCVLGAKIAKGTKLHGKSVEAEFQDFERQSVLQAFQPQYQAVMAAH